MDKRSVLAVAVIVIIVVAAVAVVVYTGDDEEVGDRTVTDVLGREVTLPDEVDTIVCLSAGSVRLACYLGAYDMIVGVDNYDAQLSGSSSNYYMATYRVAYDMQSITCVGSEENYRDIISTGADLIITSTTDKSEVDTIQSNTGIATIAIDSSGNIDVDDEDFDENLRILGKALGKEDRAEELISGKDALLAELEGYKSSSTVTASFYVGGMFYMMQGGLTMTTGNYASFDYTNAVCVMKDTNNGNPYETTIKEIAESGAEYILIDAMTLSSSASSFEQNRSVLGSLPAVEEGRIYSTLVYKYYGTNWESELMNAFFIGSLLDPGTYDYDLEGKLNGILELFYPESGLTYGALCNYQTGYTNLDW